MDPEIIVIAHNIRSSHNVGSLFRTSEGLGVKKLILSGYTPYPAHKNDARLPHIARKTDKQIDKTALGAQKFLPWEQEPDIGKVLGRLKAQGYILCGLEQSAGSIDINKFRVPDKVVLVLGNEVEGLENELLKRLDKILEIPMFGEKESFNVVQASAMALYAFRFRGQ